MPQIGISERKSTPNDGLAEHNVVPLMTDMQEYERNEGTDRILIQHLMGLQQPGKEKNKLKDLNGKVRHNNIPTGNRQLDNLNLICWSRMLV